MGKFDYRNALVTSAALVVMATAAPAYAQTRMFNVPAQPAVTGIPEFARQADVQILVGDSAARGFSTRAVKGAMTVEAALKRLLGGTGLVAKTTDGRTFVVSGAPVAASTPAPAARQDADPVELGEILVTARKREETLLEVPISVSAFSANQLYNLNATDLSQITRFTPGLSFEQTIFGNSVRYLPQIRFRGMSTNAGQPNSQVGAVFLDGVFVLGGAQSISTEDIERVEVLKGPQNTYFGRNTFGGAINFITRTPGNELKAETTAKVETRETFKFSANVEGPLIKDVLTGRLVGVIWQDGAHYKSSDGGDLGRQTTKSLTGTLNFTLGDNFHLKLRGHIQADADYGNANYPLRAQADFANCKLGTIAFFCGAAPKVGDSVTLLNGSTRVVGADAISQDTSLLPPQYLAIGKASALSDFLRNSNGVMNDIPFYGKLPKLDHFGDERRLGRITANWDYEFAEGYSLAGNAGYGEMRLAALTDADQTVGVLPGSGTRNYTYIPFMTKDYSAEARITSPQDARLRWLVGSNYYKQSIDGSTGSVIKTISEVTGIANLSTWQNSDRDRSNVIGLFGAASFDILRALTLDLEGRYQIDHLKAFQQTGLNQFQPIFRTFKEFLPRVILSYKPTRQTNLYASWSRGALPGVANASFENIINQVAAFPGNVFRTTDREAIRTQLSNLLGVDAPLTLPSEKIDQIEIGLKQEFWDGRASVSIAGYHIAWRNQKQPATVVSAGIRLPNGNVIPSNGDITGDGLSDAISARIPGRSRIYGLEFDLAVRPIRQLTLNLNGELVDSRYKGVFPGGALVASYAGSQELSNKKLFMYPLSKFSFNSRWQDELSGDWNFYLQGNATYTGKNYADEANLAWISPYVLVNTAIGVSKRDVLVELYVNNLTNFDGWLSGRRNSSSDNSQMLSLVPARKRTVGIRTRLNF